VHIPQALSWWEETDFSTNIVIPALDARELGLGLGWERERERERLGVMVHLQNSSIQHIRVYVHHCLACWETEVFPHSPKKTKRWTRQVRTIKLYRLWRKTNTPTLPFQII